jgi:hypothetical protein
VTIRRFVERTTRSWRYRRHLPSQFKSMDQVDPPLLRNARELVRLGDVVQVNEYWLFTFAAAALSGSKGAVVAFEPDAWLVQLLRRSRCRPAARERTSGDRSCSRPRRLDRRCLSGLRSFLPATMLHFSAKRLSLKVLPVEMPVHISSGRYHLPAALPYRSSR